MYGVYMKVFFLMGIIHLPVNTLYEPDPAPAAVQCSAEEAV